MRAFGGPRFARPIHIIVIHKYSEGNLFGGIFMYTIVFCLLEFYTAKNGEAEEVIVV